MMPKAFCTDLKPSSPLGDSTEDRVEICTRNSKPRAPYVRKSSTGSVEWQLGAANASPRRVDMDLPLKVRKTRATNARRASERSTTRSERTIPKAILQHENVSPNAISSHYATGDSIDQYPAVDQKIPKARKKLILQTGMEVGRGIGDDIAEVSLAQRPHTAAETIVPNLEVLRHQSIRRRVVTKIFKFSGKCKEPATARELQTEHTTDRHLALWTTTTSLASTVTEPGFHTRPNFWTSAATADSASIQSQSASPSIHSPKRVNAFAHDLPPTPPSSEQATPSRPFHVQQIAQKLPAVLHLSLKVIPEVEALGMSSETSIWTAVTICCEPFIKQKEDPAALSCRSLAVGIVLDNSRLTSQLCLERACEQVRRLSRQLNQSGDRLVIYVTSCHHVADCTVLPGGCQLFPLGKPDLKYIDRELKGIQAASTNASLSRPSLLSAISGITEAFESLDSAIDPSVRNAGREILLIVPHLTDIPKRLPDLGYARIHLITPNILPYTGRCESLSGWLLNPCSALDEGSAVQDREGPNFQDRSSLIISQARSLSLFGEIKDVFVDILAGPDAVVEEIIGPRYVAKLRPGEQIVKLIKLRVKALDHLKESYESPSRGGEHGFDVYTGLEFMLGELLRELVVVQVRYKHSCFPEYAEVVAKEAVWIRRTCTALLPGLGRCHPSSPHRQKRSESILGRKEFIQKALAISIASNLDPFAALVELDEVFDVPGFENVIPQFIGLLRDELKFQLRVQRKDLPSCSSRSQVARSTVANDFCQTRTFHRLERQSPTPTVIVHVENGARPNALRCNSGSDSAMRLWRKMRKDSRGDSGHIRDPEDLDPQLLKVRERALRNKRSIGVASLKSLTLGIKDGSEDSDQEM